MGDLRYNFIAYIEDPGARTPCGIGGPANDPETGELISAVSYIYGGSCFDYIETRMTDFMDILCAQYRRRDPMQNSPLHVVTSMRTNTSGVLGPLIFAGQGYTQARRPDPRLTSAAYNLTTDEAAERLEAVFEHAQDMEHHRSAILNRERKHEKPDFQRCFSQMSS